MSINEDYGKSQSMFDYHVVDVPAHYLIQINIVSYSLLYRKQRGDCVCLYLIFLILPLL